MVASAMLALPVAGQEPIASQPVRDFTLRLAGFEFDPEGREPALPEGWDRSRTDRADLHLVQLSGPTKQAFLDELAAKNLKVVQFVHPHTYIVWGKTQDRQAVSGESFVRWSGDFAPAFRVQPQWRSLRAAAVELRVLIYRGAGADAVVAELEKLGGRVGGRKTINKTFEVAGLTLPGQAIRDAANIPGVYSIRRRATDGGLRSEMSSQVNVNNVDGTNLAFPGYPAWLASVGLDGSGVLIANVDGGVRETHPDLVGRIVPCSGTTCSTVEDSHGTHTAGIMAADGSSGLLDGAGFLRGLGVAPGANLVVQRYSPTFTEPGGMLTLIHDSAANGALLSGNSWGPSGSPQGYDDDTMQVDVGVRDADPTTPGNQQFTYVLSFMNGYGGTGSQGSPDEGKNMFTFGSTKLQSSGGVQELAIDDLSGNSAHGPALDGRTIPHMVAPGCYVDSTDTNAAGYGLKCGTSMASPQVAGAAALFIEQYRNRPDYTADPSPALIKAAFLAAARGLAGRSDADGGTLGQPFDSKQGWGRMDLEAVLKTDPNGVQYFDDPQLFDNTGEEWSRTIAPLDPAEPARIMLVWTDAPGHGLGGSTPAWNNNLDLVVEAGGNTYRGNAFDANGLSIPGGAADGMNNTEGVFLDPAPSGGWTVRVLAADINSDGVPGVGDATDQDFALACYNCALEPTFTLGATPGANAVCAPASAEFLVEVGSILSFSDPVPLSTTGVPAGTSADFSVNPVTPIGSSTLQIQGTASAVPGSYTIAVQGVSGTTVRIEHVDLEIASAAPGVVTSLAPADGSSDVSLQPTLSWNPAAQASSYRVDVATDPAFANVVYSAQETATSHDAAVGLAPLTAYYWRVQADNVCGQAAHSATAGFTTMGVPPILLVDDDDNGPDVRASYSDTLDALGLAYDVWDTGNGAAEPDAVTMAPYETIIWFTGDAYGGGAGPSTTGETELATWLDTSRCLLIASQDYHYDRGLSSFMQSRLGVGSVTNDVGHTTVDGQGSVFPGLGPYLLALPYSNYSDRVVPDGTSELAFEGTAGNAAVNKNTGLYRTSFWGFGLEGVPTGAEREQALSSFLGWCASLPGDDGDSDGALNGVDCIPADPAVWNAPSAATNLLWPGPNDMTWSAPLAPGASVVSYDLLRALDPADFSAASCVGGGFGGTAATDPTPPLLGEPLHYLVRAVNACGSSLGVDSVGSARPGAVCP